MGEYRKVSKMGRYSKKGADITKWKNAKSLEEEWEMLEREKIDLGKIIKEFHWKKICLNLL